MDTAIQCIYRDLEYAKSLIKSKAGKNAAATSSPDGTIADDSEEESWTFVDGDNIDPELVVKKSALSQMEADANRGAMSQALGSRLLGGKGGATTVRSASTSTPGS